MKIKVQDVYAVGNRLHQVMIRDGIHYAKTPEKFEQLWRAAIETVRAEFPALPIDWEFDPEHS